MINGTPLFTPSPSFPTGAQIPQADGSFAMISNQSENRIFSVQNGVLSSVKNETIGPNEKMWLNPGGGSVNIYATDGHTYCFAYDGRQE